MDDLVDKTHETITISGVERIDSPNSSFIRGGCIESDAKIFIALGGEGGAVHSYTKELALTLIHELGHMKWNNHEQEHRDFCYRTLYEVPGYSPYPFLYPQE